MSILHIPLPTTNDLKRVFFLAGDLVQDITQKGGGGKPCLAFALYVVMADSARFAQKAVTSPVSITYKIDADISAFCM